MRKSITIAALGLASLVVTGCETEHFKMNPNYPGIRKATEYAIDETIQRNREIDAGEASNPGRYRSPESKRSSVEVKIPVK